jgi:phosphoenolpyruvate carboxykinase (ATP)
MPCSCPGVPAEFLNPRNTWREKKEYDRQAKELARLFVENFIQYESKVSKEILDAAPVTS